MNPEISININLPGDGLQATQIAEGVSVIGPPPETEGGGFADTGNAEAAPAPTEQALEADGGMPPGPEETAMGELDAGAAPAPNGVFQEGFAENETGFMPPGPTDIDALGVMAFAPGPESPDSMAGISAANVSAEAPGPESSDAPPAPEAGNKPAATKSRQKSAAAKAPKK